MVQQSSLHVHGRRVADVEDFDEPSSTVATESIINNPWEDEAVVDEKDVKHLWEDDDKPKSVSPSPFLLRWKLDNSSFWFGKT